MQLQEIKSWIKASKDAGDFALLGEYDKTRALPFEKECVSFTIRRSLMKKFRAKYKKNMSKIVEAQIAALVQEA